MTFTPDTKEANGTAANTTGYNLGTSFIWLTSETFNLMTELAWASTEAVQPDVSTLWEATFSSNIHRGQQIIDVAVRHNRKVIVTGKSMIANAQAALGLSSLKMPPATWLKIEVLKKLPDDKVMGGLVRGFRTPPELF